MSFLKRMEESKTTGEQPSGAPGTRAKQSADEKEMELDEPEDHEKKMQVGSSSGISFSTNPPFCLSFPVFFNFFFPSLSLIHNSNFEIKTKKTKRKKT